MTLALLLVGPQHVTDVIRLVLFTLGRWWQRNHWDLAFVLDNVAIEDPYHTVCVTGDVILMSDNDDGLAYFMEFHKEVHDLI
tara:strand:+ start:582 stop:827 length:246 start_codon:yes stop_codon:yes gene_type:complete